MNARAEPLVVQDTYELLDVRKPPVCVPSEGYLVQTRHEEKASIPAVGVVPIVDSGWAVMAMNRPS